MTDKEVRMAKLKKLANTLRPTIENLYCRWQEESQFEDFSTYEGILTAEIPADSGWKVVKVTKRPFGIQVTGNGYKWAEVTLSSRFFQHRGVPEKVVA